MINHTLLSACKMIFFEVTTPTETLDGKLRPDLRGRSFLRDHIAPKPRNPPMRRILDIKTHAGSNRTRPAK